MTKKTAAPEAAPETSQAADTTLHILHALSDLFDGAPESVALPSRIAENKEDICFYGAKMRHLNEIGGLIRAMIETLNQAELRGLMAMVSKDQEDKINAGVSPYSLETTEVVKKLMGDTGLGVKLLAAANDAMTGLIPHFTNLQPGEFEDLDMDEGLVVLYGVFARNYAFFSQRLLPVIVGIFANLKAKQSAGNEKPTSASVQ